jgi:hypothetical protein
MNLTEFTNIVSTHPDKLMRFVLPNGKSVPPSYHITEVGHSKKDFIDCGGTVRTTSACLLQAWVAANDEDHRLVAGKLAAILKMAGKVLPSDDLPVELEYEAPIISQFAIAGSEIADDAIVFRLEHKHTDCLAKESCGLEGGNCASDESDCCGSDEKTEATTATKGCC